MKTKHGVIFVAAYVVFMIGMYQLYAEYMANAEDRAIELFELEKKRLESDVESPETTE